VTTTLALGALISARLHPFDLKSREADGLGEVSCVDSRAGIATTCDFVPVCFTDEANFGKFRMPYGDQPTASSFGVCLLPENFTGRSIPGRVGADSIRSRP
jgi:hypothetical protein